MQKLFRQDFVQLAGQKTMEAAAGPGVKKPAKVFAAAGAVDDLPGVAGKPAELVEHAALGRKTGRIGEAGDLVDHACRIAKDMNLLAVDRCPRLRPGDGLAAGPADQDSACAAAGFTFGFRGVGFAPRKNETGLERLPGWGLRC